VDLRVLAVGSAYGEPAVYMNSEAVYIATYNPQWSCDGVGCHGEWWCGFAARRCSFSATTALVSLRLSGNGSLTVGPTARVPGYLLSQWSLDAFAGHLRVAYTVPAGATVTGVGWIDHFVANEQSDNRVDVFAEAGLLRVGRAAGLGRGERIYAVRFMGAMGYVVTFRQVDPLYVLALSDPTAPTVVGELKIPGYSDYLHPLNATLLLGVGKWGDEAGVLGGVKLSLFDVSNPASPAEVAALELGGDGSESPVESDHKALLYHRGRGLLVLPITERARPEWDCSAPPSFHGARLVRIAGGAIQLLGGIEHGPNRSHANPSSPSDPTSYGVSCPSTACASAAVRRSLYLDDALFTLSDSEVRATSLASLVTTWVAPLHTREVLTAEGSCLLNPSEEERNSSALPWARVAASGANLWGHGCSDSSACRFGDSGLQTVLCVNALAWGTYESLLREAASCCGNSTCDCPTRFNDCSIWF